MSAVGSNSSQVYPANYTSGEIKNKQPREQSVNQSNERVCVDSNINIEIERAKKNKQGVDISFEDIDFGVNIKVKEEGKKVIKNKTILNGISGICKQGEVTAILGSSGAGKTTLLNLLCKRIESDKKKNTLSGKIQANGQDYSYDNFSNFAGYIMQEDRLLETLTVKETLMFAAKLRLQGTLAEKEARVNKIIRQLKLDRCQNTYIGGNLLKGVSGGERKRVSIAFELITDPLVLFLDEPTSGLDSFTAFLTINMLRQLAQEENKTIVMTIHQPSSDIWNLLDKIILMVNGKLIYQGKGQNNIVQYFDNNGFHCPETSNPADYLMSIMHRESETNRKNYPTYYSEYDKQIKDAVQNQIDNKNTSTMAIEDTRKSNYLQEILEVWKRTGLTMTRNPTLVKGRIASTLIMALFMTAIYYQLDDGKDDPTSQQKQADYVGFIFFALVDQFMNAMMPVVNSFPAERGVFLKEEGCRVYTTTSYFIGRTMVELPFLLLFPFISGSITFNTVGLRSDSENYLKYILLLIVMNFSGNSLGLLCGTWFSDGALAAQAVPFVFVPLMLFAGLFSNRDDIKPVFRWIEYLSPFKYGFDAGMNNEFEETYFKPNPVDNYSLDFGYWNSIGMIIVLAIIFRFLAFLFLYLNKKRLQ